MSSNYQTQTKKRKTVIITTLIIITILIIAKISTSKNSVNNLQEVFQNENILGISKLISNENEKNQDEFLVRIDKLNQLVMQEQERRLDKLEKMQQQILNEIKALKTPPEKASIRDKLVYLYPYDPSAKFPAYIWQAWKYGLNDDRFEQKYRDGEAQWAFKNPGFVHELFNDDTAITIIKYLFHLVPEIEETYLRLPEVILRMDFFRYLILYAKGGVYADIDTFPLQPIPNWIPDNVSPNELGMIFSIETDSNSPNWKEEVHRRLQFGQFLIQAKPGHPILREVIARIVETTAQKSRLMEGEKLKLDVPPHRKSLEISKWTGSGIWTDVVFQYFNDYIQSSIYQQITWKDFHELKVPKLVSDILVLPTHSFASEVQIPKDGKISDPLAFVKHYKGGIWKSA